MKKIFFTLVSLLVASTVFAGSGNCLGTFNEDTKSETPLPAIVPQIDFNVVADGVFIVVTDATSYEVIVNGENMGQIDYVAADYFSKVIVVNAVNETSGHVTGEASDEYELGALMKQPVEAPVITTTMDDDYVYVDIKWPDKTDGERVYTGQYQYPRGQYDYEAAVTAYVREGSQWQASPETHYVVEVPNNWKVYETSNPVVTTELTDDQLIITAAGEGTVTLYVAIYDETTVTHTVTGQGYARYSIDRGNEDIFISYYATAVANVEGYDEIVPGISRSIYDFVPKKEEVVPPTPTEQTAAPSSSKENYAYNDGNLNYNAYTVTLSPTEESDIYYRVGVMIDGNYVYSDWILYTGELNFSDEGTYMIEAYAIAPGKTESDHIWDGFTVSKMVDVEELMADKTVSSVRYFNVAGQEMAQPNGLTIMVTTFTDGSTSAVKVMK